MPTRLKHTNWFRPSGHIVSSLELSAPHLLAHVRSPDAEKRVGKLLDSFRSRVEHCPQKPVLSGGLRIIGDTQFVGRRDRIHESLEGFLTGVRVYAQRFQLLPFIDDKL